jgi:alkylhydroperoxidase family enzyme
MPRIPLVEKEDASPEVLEFFGRVAGWLKPLPGRRSAQAERRVPQPWRLFAHSPELANRLFDGSSYIFTELPWALEHNRVRQLIILTVIRRLDCTFAYNGHWETSAKAGISRALYDQFATLDGMEAAKTSPNLSEEERLAIAYADALARTGNVSKDLFDQLLALYGPRGMVEMTAVIGYRMLTSVMLSAFDLQDDKE